MKNIFLSLSVFLAFSLFQTSFAQQDVFSKIVYSNNSSFHAFSMAATDDNSYILAGKMEYDKGIVLKVNNEGEVIWNKVFQQTNSNQKFWFNSLTHTYDSCFLIAGVIRNVSGDATDAFYTKINTEGDTLWTKSHGFNSTNVAILNVKQTNDSGFIMTGYTNEQNEPYHRVYVAKIDPIGTLEWSKTYSLGNSSMAYSVNQMPDNSFMIAGELEYLDPFEAYAFLLNLTPDGEIVWDKKYELENSNSMPFVNDVLINGNSIIIHLYIEYNSVIMATDLSGEVLWTKSYNAFSGSNLIGEVAPKMIHTSDGGYLLVHNDFFSIGGILKTDDAGEVMWAKGLVLIPQSVIETPNHEYFVIGNGPLQGVKETIFNDHIGIIQMDSLGNGEECIETMYVTSSLLTMLSSSAEFSMESGGFETSLAIDIYSENLLTENRCVDFVGGVEETDSAMSQLIYPSPNQGNFTFKLIDKKEGMLTIFNKFGQIVYQKYIDQDQNHIDLSIQSSGVYLYKFISADHETFVGKFIIQK